MWNTDKYFSMLFRLLSSWKIANLSGNSFSYQKVSKVLAPSSSMQGTKEPEKFEDVAHQIIIKWSPCLTMGKIRLDFMSLLILQKYTKLIVGNIVIDNYWRIRHFSRSGITF